jgi:hypothetical protein
MFGHGVIISVIRAVWLFIVTLILLTEAAIRPGLMSRIKVRDPNVASKSAAPKKSEKMIHASVEGADSILKVSDTLPGWVM